MTNQSLRETVINLLDDEHGVSLASYQGLSELCCENGWEDITNAVQDSNERFYLGENDAEELRKVQVVE